MKNCVSINVIPKHAIEEKYHTPPQKKTLKHKEDKRVKIYDSNQVVKPVTQKKKKINPKMKDLFMV